MKKNLISNIIITALSITAIVLMGFPFYHIKPGGIHDVGNPVGLTVMHEMRHAGFVFMWLMLIINIFNCAVCMLRIFTGSISIKAHSIIKIVSGTTIILFTVIICFSNYSITALDLGYTFCGWAIYFFAAASALNGLTQFITHKM